MTGVRVVVIGAGLGGLSAACHLVGRGHEVTVVERGDLPGGRAGLWESEGYRSTPARVCSPCRAAGRHLRRRRRRHGRPPPPRPSTPCTGPAFADDGSTRRCRHGRDAMTEEIRVTVRPGGRSRLRAVLRLAGEALPASSSPTSSTATSTRPSTWPAPARAGARPGPPRGVPQAGRRWSTASSRTTGCRSCSASSPSTPACPPSRPWPSTASSPTWTRSRACGSPRAGCTPSPRAWPTRWSRPAARSRYGHRWSGSCAGRARAARSPACACESGERIERRRGGGQPRRPCRLPRAAARDAACHGSPGGASTRRRARCGSPACAGSCRPAPATTTSTSGGDWKGSFDALLAHRHPPARPVDPGVRARPSPTHAGPAGRPRHLRPRAGAQPRRQARLDGASATGSAPRLVERLGALGLPRRRRRDRAVHRPGRLGGARAWSGARPSPCPTASSRPGRSGRHNVDRRVPGLVLVGSGTVPGVERPMVLVSGRLAADRVDQLAGPA